MNETQQFYEDAYHRLGFGAQRSYPNEELLRFFGTYYFSLSPDERARLRVLEVGCGSGANLWMIAREGFSAYGIDLSANALKLCGAMLKKWQTQAVLKQESMTSIGFDDRSFDVIVDVFAAYCVSETDFACFLDEVTRLLRPGGRFFSYTPSKNNDSFRDTGPSQFIDASTLDGIHRETSPFYGQFYPFRFIEPEEFAALLGQRGFTILRNERIGRTYHNRAEYFEFVSIHAQKAG